MKIAFLFLVISGVYHESHWQDFFTGNEQHYSLYVHAKKDVAPTSFFKPHQLKKNVPTTWAQTMNAQIELLKEALNDPSNSKFVFASESTIPLQSFDTVYAHLMQDDASWFWYQKNPHMKHGDAYNGARDLWPIPHQHQFKNSQWVVLNRKHAQILVNDTKALTFITAHKSDQEHCPSTVLSLHNLLSEVKPVDTTLVIWDKKDHVGTDIECSPYAFSDLEKYPEELTMLCRAIKEQKFLFARKILQNCSLQPLDPYLSYRMSKLPQTDLL